MGLAFDFLRQTDSRWPGMEQCEHVCNGDLAAPLLATVAKRVENSQNAMFVGTFVYCARNSRYILMNFLIWA